MSNQNDISTEQSCALQFKKEKADFLEYMKSNLGCSLATCYNYSSDLKVWHNFITDVLWITWDEVQPEHVEQFVAYLMNKNIGPHSVARKISCLSSFYKWAKKYKKIRDNPLYEIVKPKRPRRIPVWLEEDEQDAINDFLLQTDDIEKDIFGRTVEYFVAVRKRYAVLFMLIQKSGLRISEALKLKVSHIKVLNGVAKSVRVIGKGDKERIVPLPEAFGRELAGMIHKRRKDAYLFERHPNGRPMSANAVREYLHKVINKVGIDKPITPHKLRHTYATRLMEKGANILDIQALLGHESIATTQIYTHVSNERLNKLVDEI